MSGLLEFFRVEERYVPPSEPRTIEDDIQLAADMRRYMDDRNLTCICAVCSCRCQAGCVEPFDSAGDEDEEDEGTQAQSTQILPIHAIDNIHLLRVDGEKSAEFPRDGLTRIGDYCLQPLGKVENIDEDEEDMVYVCGACVSELERGRVPKASLVRLDTGAIPEGLKPLTIMEEQLLGLGRACRYIFVMRPRGADSDLQQWCFRGHVIAFPNVNVKDISDCFPMPLSDIPKNMQVCAPSSLSLFVNNVN